MTSQRTNLSISTFCLYCTLFAFSPAFALPPEHKPLKPRVPIQHRAYYRSLQAPMYQDSKNVSSELLEAGASIYQRICVNCHGESGKGNGISSGFLPILPRDFTNCLFQHKRTDGELFYVIKFGSWPMPPMVPTITEDEAWTVIPYLRTFCKK
ncbi:MAG: hypothetical protein NPIRA02_35100 [Nitrospirales bacterium]|nr:MAG: hypothetical protein NPIRA02_35100 [Nitrospirales bacterium]